MRLALFDKPGVRSRLNRIMELHVRQIIHSLVCVLALGAAVRAAEPQWQPLFDGKTLTGWSGFKDSWRVEDGALVGEIPDGK